MSQPGVADEKSVDDIQWCICKNDCCY